MNALITSLPPVIFLAAMFSVGCAGGFNSEKWGPFVPADAPQKICLTFVQGAREIGGFLRDDPQAQRALGTAMDFVRNPNKAATAIEPLTNPIAEAFTAAEAQPAQDQEVSLADDPLDVELGK